MIAFSEGDRVVITAGEYVDAQGVVDEPRHTIRTALVKIDLSAEFAGCIVEIPHTAIEPAPR